jgi:hypothetical protein
MKRGGIRGARLTSPWGVNASLIFSGWEFDSLAAHRCDVARHRRHFEPLCRVRAGLADALGLVSDGRVENEVTDELAGVRLDDADVAAVDQHQDGGSGVRPTPMWCSRPLWRRVSLPSLSTTSRRTRGCGSGGVEPAGVALGLAW